MLFILAQFPQSPPSLARPSSRNDRRVKREPWNYTSFTSPPSPAPHPPNLLTVRVWEAGMREKNIPGSHPSIRCLCFCHSTPSDNERRERQGGFILIGGYIMSAITEDELWGRSVISLWAEYEEVPIRLEAGWFKNKREEVHGFLLFSQRETELHQTGTNCCQIMMVKINFLN